MTLYELTGQYLELLTLAEDPDADEQAVSDTLEGLEGEIEEKADGYAKVIKTMQAEADAIKTEAARLQERARLLESRSDYLKNRLKYAMELTGKAKIKTTLFSFGIQKNPPSVVLETDNIPEQFLIPQPPKVDKTAIKQAITDGHDLSGIAHLEQGTSLRIR
ncbi:MAG: siphovirus Gp157 family protein [Oscillospiraceae bacterium]|nr:siphovirus Gp157 family protein [Lachnospiraceae bacterium]MBO7727975.1 siphovirus Gp157 family protein [Oscillospiraceae bacterium]